MDSLTGKRGRFFKKYRVTNARKVAQLTETLKQKVEAKAQLEGMKKGKPSRVRIRCLKTLKDFTETWA